MSIKIKAFGLIAEKMDAREIRVDQTKTTAELKALLHERYPALEKLDFAIAVDRRIVNDNTPLEPGAEVALLPPFSGG
ncbi:MAG: MoaD/ThiS family protein [Saprospirales bacterium]|nr:MAG: MoaD/ThiS family protein [Saprospirales bacterium]